MAAPLTDTQGIVAIAAAAVGGRRAARRAGCSRSACDACGARSGSCSASRANRTSSRTPRHAGRVRSAARLRRATRPAARRAPRRGRERRCAARSRTARWSATTPTTSSPGSSRCRSRCSTTNARGSCCRASTTATRRASTASRCSTAQAELELSPEEAEAVRVALADAAAAANGARASRLRGRRGAARVGFLGPAGTFSEEALLASAVAGRGRAGSAAEHPRDGHGAAARGASSWRSCRSRTRSTDRSPSRSTCSPRRPATSDRRRVAAGRQPLADRRAGGSSSSEIDTVLSHPQVPGQCARFLRAELAHARILPARSTAEAVRVVVRGEPRARARRRSARPSRREIYGGHGAARGRRGSRRQRDALRVAGACARPGSGPRRRCATASSGELEDLDRVLGRRRASTQAGWCAASTSSPAERST